MHIRLIVSKENQRTISGKFTFEGVSFFSGKKASMTCEPGKEDSGIVFYCNGSRVPALAEYIAPVDLHTTVLVRGRVTIMSVEHLLSSLWGLGIDNIKVTLQGDTVPAQEASAENYTTALLKVGVCEQRKKRVVIECDAPLSFRQPEFKDRYILIEPNSDMCIKCTAPFPKPLRTHTAEFNGTPDDFIHNICWARTFLRSPIATDDLKKWNAIRSSLKALPEDPRKSPVITFTESGFLTPLKSDDEPARHKLLDFIGDLALIGHRIHGKITVYEPGHSLTHVAAIKIRTALKKHGKAEKKIS